MEGYCYLFEIGENRRYIYALSKASAIQEYLEAQGLSILSKNCTITRILD